MISTQVFLLGLMVVSTLTTLTTEAIKKGMEERNKTYYSNTLAGIVAICLSLLISTGYILLKGMEFTSASIIYIIALVYLSWLGSMVGYDKVIQAIAQIKTKREDDK